MPLITIIIALVAVGIILYLIEKYLPISPTIKRLIQIVVVVVLVLWLMDVFGLMDALKAIKV